MPIKIFGWLHIAILTIKKNLDTDALKKSIAAWAKAHGKTINAARIDAILKARTGATNCLTCAKGVKLKTPLKSLAWMSGSSAFSKPKVMPKPAPVKDEVLPTGSEIEIDAEDTPTPKAASEYSPRKPKAAEYTPPPAASTPSYPKYDLPADGDPTSLLF